MPTRPDAVPSSPSLPPAPRQGTRPQRRITEQAHRVPRPAAAGRGRRRTATTPQLGWRAAQLRRQSAARPALPAAPPLPLRAAPGGGPRPAGLRAGARCFPPLFAAPKALHPRFCGTGAPPPQLRQPPALPAAERGEAAAPPQGAPRAGKAAPGPGPRLPPPPPPKHAPPQHKGAARPSPPEAPAGYRRRREGTARRCLSPSSPSMAHPDHRLQPQPRRCCGNAATSRPANNRRSHWPGGAGGRARAAPHGRSPGAGGPAAAAAPAPLLWQLSSLPAPRLCAPAPSPPRPAPPRKPAAPRPPPSRGSGSPKPPSLRPARARVCRPPFGCGPAGRSPHGSGAAGLSTFPQAPALAQGWRSPTSGIARTLRFCCGQGPSLPRAALVRQDRSKGRRNTRAVVEKAAEPSAGGREPRWRQGPAARSGCGPRGRGPGCSAV